MTGKDTAKTGKEAKNTSKKRQRSSPSKVGSKNKRKNSATTPTVESLPPAHTLIIDNGGDTLKYGWTTDEKPRLIPNVTARLAHQITLLVGDELSRVQNPSSLVTITRSLERGLICNLGNQTQVWKRMLDLLGVIIPHQSEAATALGWKANKKIALPTKTIPSQSIAVIILLPPHCPRSILDQVLYVWMEDFGVGHVGFGNSTVFAAQEHPEYKTSCVVDFGWSSTLVVPTFKSKTILAEAIRRLPIGGRHLTNIMKYYMSYRQYNLMDQDHILRDVLERLSFVSLELQKDFAMARDKPSGRRFYDRDFLLPDYQNVHQGQIRIPLQLQKDLAAAANQDGNAEDEDDEDDEEFQVEDGDDDDDDDESVEDNMKAGEETRTIDKDDDEDDEEKTIEQRRQELLQERAEKERQRREQMEEEQLLRVSVERFAIPEILFNPKDAGLPSELMGIPETIVHAINGCPSHFQAALYQCIHLVGGLSKIPNLKARLELEIRSLAPIDFPVKVTLDDDPAERAWLGTKSWISKTAYIEWSVTRQEWLDAGKRKAYGRLLAANGGIFV